MESNGENPSKPFPKKPKKVQGGPEKNLAENDKFDTLRTLLLQLKKYFSTKLKILYFSFISENFLLLISVGLVFARIAVGA